MAAVPEWDLPESAGTSAFSLIPQMGKAQQQCEDPAAGRLCPISENTRVPLYMCVTIICVLRCIHITVYKQLRFRTVCYR